MYDLFKPAFERLIEYRKTTKVGKSQKVQPMTTRAQTIAKNKLKKFPDNVQSSMVTKCIDNNWETVWPQSGTLEHDDKQVEAPKWQQPPEILKPILAKLEQPAIIDKRPPLEQLYETSKEDSSMIADQERSRLRKLLMG